MAKVLLNYQMQDASIASRIYKELVNALGQSKVLMARKETDDKASITEVIAHDIDDYNVMLVIMGRDWADYQDSQGNRVLDDPQNPVRKTIEHGLNTPNVTVIPLLIDSAQMPLAGKLPDSLQPLTQREAFVIDTDGRFYPDMNGLIEFLDGFRRLSIRGIVFVAVLVAAIVMSIVLAIISTTL